MKVKKLKNKLFLHVVKYPYLVIASVIICFLILILISMSSYKGIYLELNAEISLQDSASETMVFKAKVNKINLEEIKNSQRVLWYVQPDTQKYNAFIDNIIENDDSDEVDITFSPLPEDFLKEFTNETLNNQKVFIEIMVGKQKVFNSIFKGN